MLTPLLFAAVPLLLLYLFQDLRYRRFKQYAGIPQPKSSLIWGHMKALHEVIQRGAPDRHPGEELFARQRGKGWLGRD